MQRRAGLVEGWGRRELTPVPRPPSLPCTGCPHTTEKGALPGEHDRGSSISTGFLYRKLNCDLTHEKTRLKVMPSLPSMWLQDTDSPACEMSALQGKPCLHASQSFRSQEKTVLQCSPLSFTLANCTYQGPGTKSNADREMSGNVCHDFILKMTPADMSFREKKKKSFTQPLGAQSNADPPRRNDGSFNELLLK